MQISDEYRRVREDDENSKVKSMTRSKENKEL